MLPPRRRQFIFAYVGFLLVVLVLSSLFDWPLGLFGLTALIGLVGFMQLTTPVYITPDWRWRLRILLGIGIIYIMYIATKHALEVLPFPAGPLP